MFFEQDTTGFIKARKNFKYGNQYEACVNLEKNHSSFKESSVGLNDSIYWFKSVVLKLFETAYHLMFF